MSDLRINKGGVGVVSMLAMIALVSFAAWFNLGCADKAQQPAATTQSQPSGSDVTVKVDLPDTITIKP